MNTNLDIFLKELSIIHNVEKFYKVNNRYELVFGSTPITIFNMGEFVIFDCKMSEVIKDVDNLSVDELLMFSLKEIKQGNITFSISNEGYFHSFIKIKTNSHSQLYIDMLNSMLNIIENFANTYELYKKN